MYHSTAPPNSSKMSEWHGLAWSLLGSCVYQYRVCTHIILRFGGDTKLEELVLRFTTSLLLFFPPETCATCRAPYESNKGPKNDDRYKGKQFVTNPSKRGLVLFSVLGSKLLPVFPYMLMLRRGMQAKALTLKWHSRSSRRTPSARRTSSSEGSSSALETKSKHLLLSLCCVFVLLLHLDKITTRSGSTSH